MNPTLFALVKAELFGLVDCHGDTRKLRLAKLAERDPALHSVIKGMLELDRSTGALRVSPEDVVTAIAKRPREVPEVGARYDDWSFVDAGGMGEVWSVFDVELQRRVALKIEQPGPEPAALRERFIQEAQIQSQLQHPHIVPVYDVSVATNGRYYFTMLLVRGQSLRDELKEDATVKPEDWLARLRELITVFIQACSAVAYGHSNGITHRDLKPANIMIGQYGEALVIDWGLAKLGQRMAGFEEQLSTDNPRTTKSQLIGTPSFMAPEQLGGDHAATAAVDIYGLGAILYCLLWGSAPYVGASVGDVLDQVRAGPPPFPARRPDGKPVPHDLAALCEHAMASNPEARPRSVEALASGVRDWLVGAQARVYALKWVSSADTHAAEASEQRSQADTLEIEASHELKGALPTDAEERKSGGWRKQDMAAKLREDAQLVDLAHQEALVAALNHAPQLPEAHERLAKHYRRLHAAAERAGRHSDARLYATMVAKHDRNNRHADYLHGDGFVSVCTEPPGAHLQLFAYRGTNRRLVAEPLDFPHPRITPVNRMRLPISRSRDCRSPKAHFWAAGKLLMGRSC